MLIYCSLRECSINFEYKPNRTVLCRNILTQDNHLPIWLNYFCLRVYTLLRVYMYLYIYLYTQVSVQFRSVTQLCPTLCDPMNCSTPGLPVHRQLPEFTQTHVYQVSDAIQTSHPLSSPSPPAPNPSQHQGLFQ